MLPTERRTQLDGILQKMTSNGESEDAINFVVNDFKNKYSVQEQPKSFADKTRGVLDMIFGGGKVGEQIGTQKVKSDVLGGKIGVEADYSKLTPDAIARLQAKGVPTTAQQQRKETASQITAPTGLETAGSALQSAALFIPGGAGAKALTNVATKVGVKTGASALGKIGAGILAGEAFDVASNLQQGKTGSEALTPGLGSVIGGAIPAAGVAKNVMVRFGERQAPRIINSLIKPLAKDFAYGKNPGRTIASEGIIANNFDDLLTGIRASRQKIGQEIGNLGDTLSQKPLLNIKSALNPLDEAAKSAASQNNTTLLSRINNVKRALTDVLEPQLDETGNLAIKSVGSRDLENLTFQQARHVLSDVGDLTAFTGNPTDDKLVNSALKKVYGAIKEETLKVADNIDPQVGAEFRKLTEKYADLTSAEVATKYRDKIIERQDLIGLSPRNVGIGTGLITAVATGGATIPAILAGVTGATLDKLASTPAFKTRLAYLLSTKTQNEANYLFRKIPALSKFFNTKSGVLPGDVVLNKAKQALQETKGLNKQAGFISLGKDTSNAKDLLRKQIELDDISSRASDKVRSFANSQGLIDDVTKANTEYIQAKKESDIALRNLQNFNSSSEGKLLQSEMRKLGVVERQKLKRELGKDSELIKEAKKYKSAEEFIKAINGGEKGIGIGKYGKSGLDPTEIGSWSIKDIASGKSPLQKNTTIDELKLSNQQPDIFMSFKESGAKGNIKDGYTIYRVTPKNGSINAGDFVFSNEKSARAFLDEYGYKRGQTEIQKIEGVKLDELLLPKTENEFYRNHNSSMKFPVDELIYAPKNIQNIGNILKSQLESIWKQAHSKTGEAGKILKSPLAIGAGATTIGAIGAKMSKENKQTVPVPTQSVVKPIEPDFKKEIAFRETGIIKDPAKKYKAVNKNTNGTVDLGKYQVNNQTLKTYAKKFLGKATTSQEFLNSPALQEKFFESYIQHMKSKGITDKNLVIALWHRGFGNLTKERLSKLLKEKLSVEYVNNKPE